MHVYDPKVKKEDAMTDFKYKNMDVNEDKFIFANSPKQAVDRANALVVLTVWAEFTHYPHAELNPC